MPTPSKAASFLKKQVDAGMIAQLDMALKLPRHPKHASPLQVQIAEKVNAQIEKALKPAEVTITVTKFKDIFAVNGSLKNRSTGARMDMKMKDHPRVRIERPKPGKPEFDKLVIGPKGATLQFRIKPARFYPIGIAFKLRKAVRKLAAGDQRRFDQRRLGLLHFKQSQMPRDRHTLLITDSFKDHERDDHYKFSVIIQEASTGQIGIIDPPLDHEH